jgi:hypothetical protein
MFSHQDFIINKISFSRKGEVKLELTDDSVYPLYWYGSKIQDYWIDNNWRKLLKKGMEVRLWTIQSSRVMGMQCLLKGQWVDAWCVGNRFGNER